MFGSLVRVFALPPIQQVTMAESLATGSSARYNWRGNLEGWLKNKNGGCKVEGGDAGATPEARKTAHKTQKQLFGDTEAAKAKGAATLPKAKVALGHP